MFNDIEHLTKIRALTLNLWSGLRCHESRFTAQVMLLLHMVTVQWGSPESRPEIRISTGLPVLAQQLF